MERSSVLHAVRLASLADVGVVVARTGLDRSAVEAVLADALDRGWVVHRTGRVAGWSLTAAGRVEGMRLLAAELDASGERPTVEAAYQRFLDVNQRFLEVCTRWQLRGVDGTEPVPNDHTDAAHDAAVLAELEELHVFVVDEVTRPVAGSLARFETYPRRFVHAIERVRSGDLDWFTRPLVDSYHTVWFELHDDLLATLGRDRAAERRERAQMAGREPMHATPSARDQTGGGGTGADSTAEE
jgi:hypothetical protein